jgi:iron complex transport system substrate-binding protein
MRERSRGLTGVLLATAFTLAACGGSAEETATDAAVDEPATEAATDETSDELNDVPFPRTFVHDDSLEADEYYQHLPNEVVIEARPQRIVSLAPGEYTDALLALGVEPVGTSTYGDVAGRSVDDPEVFPPAIGEQAVEAGLFAVGSCCEFDAELLATLDPELFLGTTYSADGDANLEQLAPLVEPFGSRDWRETFRRVAFAIGEDGRAEEIVADWDARAAELRARLEGTQVALVRPRPDPVYVYGPPSNAGTILAELGLEMLPAPEGSSITADAPGAIGDISLERISEVGDAEHLFVITYNVDDQQLEEYTSNPLWQQLPAVQDGNVHLVEGTAWTNHGPIGADVVLDEIEAALLAS